MNYTAIFHFTALFTTADVVPPHKPSFLAFVHQFLHERTAVDMTIVLECRFWHGPQTLAMLLFQGSSLIGQVIKRRPHIANSPTATPIANTNICLVHPGQILVLSGWLLKMQAQKTIHHHHS
jgi:hypothetical protein